MIVSRGDSNNYGWIDAPLGMKQVNTHPNSLISIAFSSKKSINIQKCPKTKRVTCSAFQTKRAKILSDNRGELSCVNSVMSLHAKNFFRTEIADNCFKIRLSPG